MNTKDNITLKKVKENSEDYRTTILALQAIIGFLTWDKKNNRRIRGSKDSFGRKMDTSAKNQIAPNSTITPDAIIQKDISLGYIVEAKKSLPNNQEHWQKIVNQIKKYDDNLKGWWTDSELIGRICLILLLEISRSHSFKKYIEKKIERGEITPFTYPFSIVEFSRSLELNAYLFIRKYWGKIEDKSTSERLENGEKIPILKLIGSYGEKKFYDSPPEVEYIMVILWQDIFTAKKYEVEYDENKKAYAFDVNIGELTKELQMLFGSKGNEHREISYPQYSWVRQAIEEFEKINLAEKKSDDGDYTILVKKINGNIIDKFYQQRRKFKKKINSHNPDQTNMFKNEASN